MRKITFIFLLLSMLSLNACAQWYIFPGRNGQKKQQENTVVKAKEVSESKDTPMPEETVATSEDLETAQEPFTDEYSYIALDPVKVALILPLQAGGNPSANFYEMYSGALMAVRDLSEEGIAIELNVFDSADNMAAIDEGVLENNDVILGPVSSDDLTRLLAICPADKMLISPLEPKAQALADSLNLIQAPSPWTCQYTEIADWISSELRFNESVLLIKDEEGLGEQAECLIASLDSVKVKYLIVSNLSEESFPKGSKTKCVIASDRDEFISSAIRTLNTIVSTGDRSITLYGTSKTRNAATDIKGLHNLDTHFTASYFIDYDNPEVKDFILKYRALFNNEPGSFAFQGYDTMHYFLNAALTYGRQWHKKLPEYNQKGLQADFEFQEDTTRTGNVNSAARRIHLNKDLSTFVH